MINYLLKNACLYQEQKFSNVDILIIDGKINEIGHNISTNYPIYDLKGKLVCHNFIDIHTHLREPGYEHKETIASGSLSGLYGGFGTMVAMANTLPCMDNIDTIRDFQKRVERDAHINVYTYSAITKNLEGKELVDMELIEQENIVHGFSDDGKGVQSDEIMDLAMQLSHNVDSIIVAHCEDESELNGGCIHEGKYANENGLVGINSASEYKQVARDIDLVREIHNRYHICHISTKETVQLLREGIKEGLKISGEVSPHHLILTDENIKDCHPNYKMNPPLRSQEDHEALIRGLNDKTISVIATDHAPHARDEKNRSIQDAPFGIIGIQHAFPLLYTYIIKKGLVSLETVLDAFTVGPARVLGLNATIDIGKNADLCIFDLDKKFVIEENDICSLSINTPFLGVECFGKIIANIVNGKITMMEDI